MKELEMKEKSSKSLLANVLDMDDDFRWGVFIIIIMIHNKEKYITNSVIPSPSHLLQSDNF